MITVITKRPFTLLRNLNEAIDNLEIRSWGYDKDYDYTHKPLQWRFRAWFRPRVTKGEKIEFIIIGNTNHRTTIEDFAVYHGRFAEMLIMHVNKYISKIEITPVPSNKDLIKINWDED